MSITPRKEEITALVGLLEEDEYESADKLAAALFKRVWELVQDRNLYGLRRSYAGIIESFGPFSSEKDALKAAERSGLAGVWDVGYLWPAGRMELRASADKEVCACTHLRGAHDHAKARGMCLAGARSIKTRPCPCTHFQV